MKVKEEEQGNIFDTCFGSSCCRNQVEFDIVEDDSDTVVVLVLVAVDSDYSNDDVDESLFHFL